MSEQDSKVFDISRPRPTNTSRPVIVGHRPMMSDPMVTRPPKPEISAAPPPPAPENHQAKTIEVSTQMQAAVSAQASPPPPAPTPALPSPAPEVSPKAIPIVENFINPLPAVAPAEPAPQLHLQSLPVAHTPMSAPGRLQSILLWLLVIIVLGAVAAYLVIDAGLISTNINLPFHIFGGQA